MAAAFTAGGAAAYVAGVIAAQAARVAATQVTGVAAACRTVVTAAPGGAGRSLCLCGCGNDSRTGDHQHGRHQNQQNWNKTRHDSTSHRLTWMKRKRPAPKQGTRLPDGLPQQPGSQAMGGGSSGSSLRVVSRSVETASGVANSGAAMTEVSGGTSVGAPTAQQPQQ